MKEKQQINEKSGMSIIVKTVTKWTVLLIILYGLYLTFFGHISPGGGFAGGVILALSLIHLILAYGKEVVIQKFSEKLSTLLESIGGLLFLIIAILGFTKGIFFKNFLGNGKEFELISAGIIIPSNFAIMLKVGFGMFSAFLCLILFSYKDKE